ncbi:MAG: DUF2007 domain-containing protein [Bacteroidota bacterium]
MPMLPEDQDSHWEAVFSTTLLYKAEIMRGLLEEEGIQAVIVNKQDSSYISFGEIEVFVPRDEVLNAKQVMERAVTDE